MTTIVCIALLLQMLFYGLVFSRLALYRSNEENSKGEGCTLIICYRNEGRRIDETLPSILEQDFEELILIDDNSSDDTNVKLNQYRSDKIRIITIDHETRGKKNALLTGIRAAKTNRILVTDADCVPASKNWTKSMGKSSKDFVLGYGPMEKGGGIIGMFSRYETYMTALQYLSYALIGVPYMGVGRNMRIDKSLIMDNAERIKGAHLASGDDDLMVNQLANAKNTSICIEEGSFVYSKPKSTLCSFLNQKVRHISTSPY